MNFSHIEECCWRVILCGSASIDDAVFIDTDAVSGITGSMKMDKRKE